MTSTNANDEPVPTSEPALPHRFLAMSPEPPNPARLTAIAIEIMNHYSGQRKSKSQWLKDRLQVTVDGSRPISLRTVEGDLRSPSRGFNAQSYGLPPMLCAWLDSQVVLHPRFHAIDNGNPNQALTFTLPVPIGGTFPIEPKIDREGGALTSAQLSTLSHIMSLRNQVVLTSDQFESNSWLQAMRMYLFELTSVLDMTLHQIYFKAKYNALPGWTFDEHALNRVAPLHGGRARSKIQWIHRITGVHMETIADELKSYDIIRRLRNHLSHWDPPCLAFTLEEVASWLNAASAIGVMLWKIRRAVHAPLCEPLISLLLAPDVVFVPADPRRSRAPVTTAGYRSVEWPREHLYSAPGVRVPSAYSEDAWNRMTIEEKRESWRALVDLVDSSREKIEPHRTHHVSALNSAKERLQKLVER